ncbi:MAG: gfo/Idh/MocA family oxidoreductase, partial [Thermoguttaceae bacterium]|nr:gfo/Idh/MocA family oxidoreductase [Thermoguttaceae bacterium]
MTTPEEIKLTSSQATRSLTEGQQPMFGRRDFLLGAAAASASVARMAHASPPPERKIRVGIVGGRFGTSFQFHEHPQCVVAGVTDLRPERRKRLQEVYRCENVY